MSSGPVARRPNEVDLSQLTFSDVKSLASGAKMIYVNMEGNNLYVQTPELDLPFDSEFFPDGSDQNTGKMTINVQMKNHTEDGRVKDFYDMVDKMDQLIKEKASENSQAWLKKKTLSSETIESLYTNMIRLSLDKETGEPNGKYPPQFRYKIKKNDGKWMCRFYDESKQPIENPDVENLFKKGSKIKALLKCTCLWIANGKFGCSWQAEQVIVKKSQNLEDYAFRSDDEDEEDTPNENVQLIDSSSEQDEDEEEEEDEEEDEEEEVVQKPKAKKRSSKKK